VLLVPQWALSLMVVPQLVLPLVLLAVPAAQAIVPPVPVTL
jgi:hypothetical protein